MFQPFLICKAVTADGWRKGNVLYGCKPGNSAGSVGMGVGFDRDTVSLLTGTSAGGIRHVDSAGVYNIPSAANWDLGVTGLFANCSAGLLGMPGTSPPKFFKTGAKPNPTQVTTFLYREGGRPFYVEPFAECLTNDGVFRQGDIVSLGHADTALNRIVAVAWDGISLKLLWDTSVPVVQIGGGAVATLDLTKWQVYLEGFA